MRCQGILIPPQAGSSVPFDRLRAVSYLEPEPRIWHTLGSLKSNNKCFLLNKYKNQAAIILFKAQENG
jgi:hypothetical protein